MESRRRKVSASMERLSLTIVEALKMALWMSFCGLVDMVVNPRSGE